MNVVKMNQLLQEHILLCAFMQLKIISLSANAIATTAPLAPNQNMHGTGFAGAQYSLAVATGWALVHNRLDEAGVKGQLVVKEATIHYKRPVTGDLELNACFHDSVIAEDTLVQGLSELGRVKFPLIVNIYSNGKKCGYLDASYIVVA